jgi:acetylornithine deacetylase/succinyl-diaminopimelate desuccinylase-like protein
MPMFKRAYVVLLVIVASACGGSNSTTGDFHVGHIGEIGPGASSYVLNGGALSVGGTEYIDGGSLTQNGGVQPNVVPDYAKIWFFFREATYAFCDSSMAFKARKTANCNPRNC